MGRQNPARWFSNLSVPLGVGRYALLTRPCGVGDAEKRLTAFFLW